MECQFRQRREEWTEDVQWFVAVVFPTLIWGQRLGWHLLLSWQITLLGHLAEKSFNLLISCEIFQLSWCLGAWSLPVNTSPPLLLQPDLPKNKADFLMVSGITVKDLFDLWLVPSQWKAEQGGAQGCIPNPAGAPALGEMISMEPHFSQSRLQGRAPGGCWNLQSHRAAALGFPRLKDGCEEQEWQQTFN